MASPLISGVQPPKSGKTSLIGVDQSKVVRSSCIWMPTRADMSPLVREFILYRVCSLSSRPRSMSRRPT